MKCIASAIILLLTLSGCQEHQNATTPSGRYQLQVDQEGNAWRLDSVSGETKRCWRGTPGAVAPRCITAVQTNEY